MGHMRAMTEVPKIFDRAALRRQRERHADALVACDFLIDEVASRLVERLEPIRRRFPVVLDLGCHHGQLGRRMVAAAGIETLVQADLSFSQVARAPGLRVVCDEELLPFASGRFDAVVSGFSLHWVNDLPGTLAQIHALLRPDGLFLAAIAGGRTLVELRGCLLDAELEATGGAAARVSPFADVRDAGMLLQRANFALPVVDCETVTVTYAHPWALLADVRRMGEASVLTARDRRPLPRAVLMRALELYGERFADERGRVPATFELVMLTAWKPAPGQQRPLARGSAEMRLADALRVPSEARPPRED